ncbi:energy-coupling factor transporter transmembrane component T family protein [Paragemmobacter ruber]|uniref:Energy-coupling factor transporter transmembrane protein EcfT n=1 Tax=Paragemmobacter ruber TaxID=1985673 RepID=A0ABW9Y195_9RHOB|nr:energy-coupling factor transporter transmembrane component T [Rhodobacter ruber]NBE06246.1 energy-coupling factor transporter transmembrane protein EcfT [Rhodobacter ruber]
MLALTSPVATPLHRLPAGAKLAALALFTAALFRFDTLPALAAALGTVAALHLPGGLPFASHALRLLRPLWPFVLILILWHLWTDDLRGGSALLLRLITAVAAANLVTMTTRLSDMIAVIEGLAAPLARLGLPPRTLALAIALTIRFLPVLSDRLSRITEAWRARSARRPGWRILVPATLATLDDADQVAEALRARGGAG